jgi:Uma2 family endonuclease
MAMRQLDRVWTRAEVLALPSDGSRYELIDGQLLVSPSPRPVHQIALGCLYRIVADYVDRHRIGIASFSPADLDLQSEQVSQPDLFVLPPVEHPASRDWSEFGIPLLAVEVLSPATARFDRVIKRRRYQRSGVAAYWIVDLDSRIVEVWRPDSESPRITDEQLDWQPSPDHPPLVIDLVAFFRNEWLEQ